MKRGTIMKSEVKSYRYLWLLMGWVFYFAAYVLTERLIPPEKCYSVHIPWDDWIPFMEIFLIPYIIWYVLIAASLGWFALRDVKSFKALQIYLMIVQVISVLCHILLPTRQDLRPTEFPRDNLLTQLVQLLYRIDTNTGVSPSLHCACSMAIASVWCKTKTKLLGKWLVVLLAALICASTCFIKQHSAMDFFTAIPVVLIAETVVFGKYWTQKKRELSA